MIIPKKKLDVLSLVAATALALTSTTLVSNDAIAAAKKDAPRQVLLTNVNIFNGTDGMLIENGAVLRYQWVRLPVSSAQLSDPIRRCSSYSPWVCTHCHCNMVP